MGMADRSSLPISLLPDPKPFVVGIGWVVECVEHRARIDEMRFSVDLDGINIAGTNKVLILFLHKRPILNKYITTASAIYAS